MVKKMKSDKVCYQRVRPEHVCFSILITATSVLLYTGIYWVLLYTGFPVPGMLFSDVAACTLHKLVSLSAEWSLSCTDGHTVAAA